MTKGKLSRYLDITLTPKLWYKQKKINTFRPSKIPNVRSKLIYSNTFEVKMNLLLIDVIHTKIFEMLSIRRLFMHLF